MQKLPRLSGKELIKILSKIGFKTIRQKGSHVILVKEDANGKRSTVVPLHTEIDKGTLLEILRQAGLSREQFMELLK
ncbi:MAG TPA: type II toxin-antitoxin system HicA family toxin [Candidatus Nanoarchaeia archaeon]|nr:type II toxin-antitoxin system HicA family toxin [Candidatus Nanoarchaeia archaeon]